MIQLSIEWSCEQQATPVFDKYMNDFAEEVAAEVSRKFAISMLKDNHPAELITECTGLSVEKVKKLKLEI